MDPSVVRSVVPSQRLFKQRTSDLWQRTAATGMGTASGYARTTTRCLTQASGPSELGTLLLFLLMDSSDLKHLSPAPFPDAVEWRWEWSQGRNE